MALAGIVSTTPSALAALPLNRNGGQGASTPAAESGAEAGVQVSLGQGGQGEWSGGYSALGASSPASGATGSSTSTAANDAASSSRQKGTDGSFKSGDSGATDKAASSGTTTTASGKKLTPAQEEDVAKLQALDKAVRAHEQAHMAAGGGLVRGGASFSYERGPDGQSYAVGGEVSIDTSPGSTPADTIAKAQQIQAAALAPADPSSQDRAVAAAAAQMEARAREEQSRQQVAPVGGGSANKGNGSTQAGRQGAAAYGAQQTGMTGAAQTSFSAFA